MKLLRLDFSGLKMFKDDILTIDFHASDRVADTRGVTPIDKPIYTQNVMAIAGINATGKTTTLKLIAFAINLLSGAPASQLMQNSLFPGMIGERLVLDALFYHEGSFYRLLSEIDPFHAEEDTLTSTPVLVSESLWKKSGPLISKKLLDSPEQFSSSAKLAVRRSELPKQALDYLPDSVSIVSALTKGDRKFVSLAVPKDADWLHLEDEPVEKAIMQVFDSSIDRFDAGGDGGAVIEFKGGASVHASHAYDLTRSLSSGTIKGANIVRRAIHALKTGGFLLVDEIENHLNKQLVGMIIDLFESNETNPHGATLVFSTHYPEILDYLKRKDNVYFLVRDDDCLISAVRYSDKVSRIENKKSEVFLANYIEGTAPRYSEVRELRHLVRQAVEGDSDVESVL